MAIKLGRNFLHIIRDFAELLMVRLRMLGDKRDPRDEERTKHNKFDVLPMKALPSGRLRVQPPDKKGVGRDASGNSTPAKAEGSPSKNYAQMYMEQREKAAEAAKQEATAKKLDEIKREAEKAEAAKIAAAKVADEHRARAREIKNQIIWWQQQTDLGQYDQSTIDGNIYSLNQQLSTIPPEYWP